MAWKTNKSWAVSPLRGCLRREAGSNGGTEKMMEEGYLRLAEESRRKRRERKERRQQILLGGVLVLMGLGGLVVMWIKWVVQELYTWLRILDAAVALSCHLQTLNLLIFEIERGIMKLWLWGNTLKSTDSSLRGRKYVWTLLESVSAVFFRQAGGAWRRNGRRRLL